MSIAITQAALNLGTAVGLGAVIGFERQWRQRLAGLEVLAEVSADRRSDGVLEQIVGRLSLEPSVTAVRWRVESSIE